MAIYCLKYHCAWWNLNWLQWFNMNFIYNHCKNFRKLTDSLQRNHNILSWNYYFFFMAVRTCRALCRFWQVSILFGWWMYLFCCCCFYYCQNLTGCLYKNCRLTTDPCQKSPVYSGDTLTAILAQFFMLNVNYFRKKYTFFFFISNDGSSSVIKKTVTSS